VHARSSGSDGVEAVRKHQPRLVIVDLALADFDGVEASRRIRLFSDAYLIILAAGADEADAVMGLTAGADDYVPKPFRPGELRARITALLRRPLMLQPAGEVPEEAAQPFPQPDFAHNGLTLHEGLRRVAVDGSPVELTQTQFDVLLCLLKNGRTIQTKADLVRWLRNEPYNTGSSVSLRELRAVEVHLSNLRKRLGDSSRTPRWLETVHGLGYRMTP
jgi:DNA-binding response OmpR family regulator